MAEKRQSYIENHLDVKIKQERDYIQIKFQKEKIKLQDELEVSLLNSIHPNIKKEITFTDDELLLTFYPEKYHLSFQQLLTYEKKERWMFAAHLVKSITSHSSTRLHLFICPENIVIDESMAPIFLHYGVKESVPPYEKDDERTLQETKALIAAAVDPKYSFEQYYQFTNSIEIMPIVEDIMNARNEEELINIIQQQLNKIVVEEKSFTKITLVKHNWLRYSIIALLLFAVPLSIYSGYSLFILKPRQEAFINAQEHFLQKRYSEVITMLSNYEVEDMPKVVQYELTISHIVNETLAEVQKDNVLKTISLQTDPRYYEYWIFIGRGEAEKALTIARHLEDIDLIMLALLHYEDAVKQNNNLKEEERERLLKEIKTEKQDYERQIKELQELMEQAEEIENDTQVQNEMQETNAPQQTPEQPEEELERTEIEIENTSSTP